MTEVDRTVTLKLCHGGTFSSNQLGLIYMGRCVRTVGVDPDEMRWCTLIEEAEKCGSFRKDVDAIFFSDPTVGLKRAVDDNEVHVIRKQAILNRVVECFIIVEKDLDEVLRLIELRKESIYCTQPKKLTPKRRRGPPHSIPFCETLKESHDHNSPKVTSPFVEQSTIENHTPTLLQTPKKPTKTSEKPTRCSPRFAPKNITTNSPTHSYNFNELRVADVFDSYEEEADFAAVSETPLFDVDDSSESAESDPGYVPSEEGLSDSEGGISDLDFIVEEDTLNDTEVEECLIEVEVDYDDNSDDDEVRQAREKVREWNANALKIAAQLQLEAASGKLPGQEKRLSARTNDPGEGHLSDYDKSGEEEDSPGENEEESRPGHRKKTDVPVVDERTDFSKLRWCVGIRFPNRESFRDCVVRYAVAQGRNLKVDVSDKARGKRLRVRCLPSCPFRLYGSWDTKKAAFVVKSVVSEHTCQRTMGRNRQMKSTWLAKQFLDVFKARPHWPASEIIETVRRAYKVIIEPGYAYKVKYHAHRMLHGSMKEHYSKLGSYIAALQQANPSSNFTLYKNPSITASGPVFQRFFVCFDALKQGWLLGCRRILCVDSCFLKTFLGGQLISVVGRDANEQMYPLAWAVVEGENNESYEWFFQQLKSSLGEVDGDGWTFISDEHQSIVAMIAKEFPKAEHRHCARHIFAHWHKSYRGDEFKMMFWQCAKAYNEADFNDALDAMREVDPKAADAFLACKPNLFCRAFVKTSTKNDVIVNNMAETFNAYIINARAKHLIYMLEDIRVALIQRMVTKKSVMEKKKGVLCPRVQEKLDEEKELAAMCSVLPSSRTIFQVKHGIDDSTVDLEGRACTCRKWDLTGIPCCHGVAAIFTIDAHPEDYVDALYKRETYLTIYNGSIPPCPGERHWPKVALPLNPPPIKVGPGRPRKNRRKDPFEDPKKSGKLTRHGVEMSCSICRSKTHNKRKCPDKDKVGEPPAKRGRGRPRRAVADPPEVSTAASNAHHELTAQPTRVGRGGRVIRSGRGGRGAATGGRGGARGAARGGRRGGRAPIGMGVLFDDQGSVFTNEPRSVGGPQSAVSVEENATLKPSTQASVNQQT